MFMNTSIVKYNVPERRFDNQSDWDHYFESEYISDVIKLTINNLNCGFIYMCNAMRNGLRTMVADIIDTNALVDRYDLHETIYYHEEIITTVLNRDEFIDFVDTNYPNDMILLLPTTDTIWIKVTPKGHDIRITYLKYLLTKNSNQNEN